VHGGGGGGGDWWTPNIGHWRYYKTIICAT